MLKISFEGRWKTQARMTPAAKVDLPPKVICI